MCGKRDEAYGEIYPLKIAASLLNILQFLYYMYEFNDKEKLNIISKIVTSYSIFYNASLVIVIMEAFSNQMPARFFFKLLMKINENMKKEF